MSYTVSSHVSIVDGFGTGYSNHYKRIRELLDSLNEPLSCLIRPGDKVFLKPDFKNPLKDSIDGPKFSRAEVIQALIEILKDCGAVVSFGDEGSPNPYPDKLLPSRKWLHKIARKTSTELVNFRLSGGILVKGSVSTPRRYLISRALLDADAVINLAHFHFHPKYGINGCVKNMFNAVLGNQQHYLEELFRNSAEISRRVVDVCRIVKPVLSIMDMTMYGLNTNEQLPKNTGYLLASQDPVSVDTVVAEILGIDPQLIKTCQLGQAYELGSNQIQTIAMHGDYDSSPSNPGFVIPQSFFSHNHSQKSLTRFINETVFRPRPGIKQESCDLCGYCKKICPVSAISHYYGNFTINTGKCVECLWCVDVCQTGAIQRRFPALVRFLRYIAGRPVEVNSK